MKLQSTTPYTRLERTAENELRYPTKPFAVWYDTRNGPLPYLMDKHTHARCTEALDAAQAWARMQAGNRARVYNRLTGRVIARYCQVSSGEVGYILFDPQGKVVCAQNKRLIRGNSVDRACIAQTLTVDTAATRVYLLWKNYAAARRHLFTMLREWGEQLNARKLPTLRALLQHYGLDLSDEVAGKPDANAGTLLFPAEYYDAGRMHYLLSCMAGFVYPGSFILARQGERHIKIGFGGGDYLHIDATEEQAELERELHSLLPCYRVAHPDGGTCEARSRSQFDAAALDVLLWRLLFAENKGAYESSLDADYDPGSRFVAETIHLVAPRLEEDGRLQTLIQLEPRFFTQAWVQNASEGLSPAALTLWNVGAYIEELYQDHWKEVVTHTKALLQQQ